MRSKPKKNQELYNNRRIEANWKFVSSKLSFIVPKWRYAANVRSNLFFNTRSFCGELKVSLIIVIFHCPRINIRSIKCLLKQHYISSFFKVQNWNNTTLTTIFVWSMGTRRIGWLATPSNLTTCLRRIRNLHLLVAVIVTLC